MLNFAGWFVVMACGLGSPNGALCYYTASGDGLVTVQDCQQYGRVLAGKKNSSFKCVELFSKGS